MSQPLPPFTCTYSPNLPELLQQLNCSLAISTYQAGKVIFISAKNDKQLVQLPRNFNKPMGMALQGKKLAIATKDEVVILVNSPTMAPNYPNKKNTYDSLYLPRATYYTGSIDLHDLEWVNDELWGVNTLFSCLAKFDSSYSFTPVWKPAFIENYSPVDYCHLNGIAMENGKPKYATALAESNTSAGWREQKATGGIVIDVENNTILARNLPMPHSPRLVNGKLYVLLSATGEIATIDRNSGDVKIVKTLKGFVRGMSVYNDYMFIGLSKLRETSKSFNDLPISKKSVHSGIAVLHEPTQSLVGFLKYENSVEEIYDIKVIPGTQRPGILNHEKEDHKIALTSPVGDFWAIKEKQDT